MRPFEIFKPGRHTASSGQTLDFTEDMLRASVAAYDPKVSPAPIVVGHPKDNGPAFGWVGGLEFSDDGKIVAKPDQIDAEFSELVKAGRFRTRSASWYLPDSPHNPKPGTLYLRHVGFLGAQPPAVKGLKDVQFADKDEGVVEFADSSPYIWSTLGVMFRGIRDWIIGEKGVEAADKILPNFYLTEIEGEGRRLAESASKPVASFNETEHSMTPEQIKALQDKVTALEAENVTLKASQKPADFAEREASLAQREQALTRKEVEGQVDALIAGGKLAPAMKAQTVSFAMALDNGTATIEFGEGDKAEKLTPRAHYLRQLEAAPKVVDFGERSKPAAGGKDVDEDIGAVQARIRDQVASGGKAAK